MDPLMTPDGRYLIVCGRLWRTTNPGLGKQERERLVHDLMNARRAVNSAKRGLVERGPVWWTDGEPDWNQHMVKNTPMRGGSHEVDAGLALAIVVCRQAVG
ncbi:hypothetical protein ABQY68_06340 [Xanthomonas hortorum]